VNILYLMNHVNVGGITSYVFTLTKGLKKRGHNIYIASSGGELLPKFIEAQAIYLAIPIRTKSELSLKLFFCRFKLSRWLKENRIEIIHSHSRTTQVLGCWLGRSHHIPHISTCHGFFRKRLSRRLFPCWGEKTIAVSNAVKEHLHKDFGVPQEAIRVINSGIDISELPVLESEAIIELKRKIGLNEGPVIGIVARLSAEKGHSFLIQAMQEVVQKIPQAQLVIAGEGRMQRELLLLTQALGLEKKIFFLPSDLDARKIMAVLDVFVLPSLKEGLGLALMEAMGMGLAVVGTDVGGISSLIRHGENGLLVRPSESHNLALALLELLNDPKKRKALGENGRLYIRDNFSQEEMVSKTEGVYQECLSVRL